MLRLFAIAIAIGVGFTYTDFVGRLYGITLTVFDNINAM